MQGPQNKTIESATKTLIDELLLEKIPLAGVARVGVSASWLRSYANAKYQTVPRQVQVQAKKRTLDALVRRDVAFRAAQRQ